MALVSAFENAEDYNNGARGNSQDLEGSGLNENDAFYLLSPNGKPFNGAVAFYNTIIMSTEDGRLFKLTGSDSTNYAIDEYYPGSAVLGSEGIANIGNDLVFVRSGREVERLSSTERFGDISTDDLSKWIPTSVKLMSDPIVVYDQEKQKIYFFDSGLTGLLVLDKKHFDEGRQDSTGQLSPWILYKTNLPSNFTSKCAVQVRDPLSTKNIKTVFWGDDSGNIYNMNGTSGGGDGGEKNVSTYRKTRIIGELDTINEVMSGIIQYTRKQNTNSTPVELAFNWGDEYHRELVTINLKTSFAIGGAVFFGDGFYWNETDNYWNAGRVVDDQVSSLSFSAPGRGQNFQLEVQITDTDDFSISGILV